MDNYSDGEGELVDNYSDGEGELVDNYSVEHFKAVRTEIEGRFFSAEEAAQLKEAIDRATVTDRKTRAAAAACWAPPREGREPGR